MASVSEYVCNCIQNLHNITKLTPTNYEDEPIYMPLDDKVVLPRHQPNPFPEVHRAKKDVGTRSLYSAVTFF